MKIGVAVVGVGSNGGGAVEAACANEHVGRVIGVDIDPAAGSWARKKFGLEIVRELAPVLADPGIHLVFISTPNATHAAIGKQAIEAGKAVCMEKPMGVNWTETEALLAAVRKTGGFLQVGFECRNYSRLYVDVKKILDSGEIGQLRHINCQYSLSPWGKDCWHYRRDAAGGIFQEKLCHYVDLPRWWTGSPVRRFFCAKAANVMPYYEIADNVELTCQFANGVVSHLTFVYGAAGEGSGDLVNTDRLDKQRHEGYRLSYQLIGTEGAVEANVFWRELRVFHHPGKPGLGDKSKMVRKTQWIKHEDNLQFHNTADEKRDVIRRVAEGLPPALAPEDAAETMRLCYAAEEALESGEWKIVEFA